MKMMISITWKCWGSVWTSDYQISVVLTFFCNSLPQVCATYMDGFRATAVCPVVGPRAAQKARRTAESILKRFVLLIIKRTDQRSDHLRDKQHLKIFIQLLLTGMFYIFINSTNEIFCPQSSPSGAQIRSVSWLINHRTLPLSNICKVSTVVFKTWAVDVLCRTRRMFRQLGLDDYIDVNVQVLGTEDTYGPHAVNTVGSSSHRFTLHGSGVTLLSHITWVKPASCSSHSSTLVQTARGIIGAGFLICWFTTMWLMCEWERFSSVLWCLISTMFSSYESHN